MKSGPLSSDHSPSACRYGFILDSKRELVNTSRKEISWSIIFTLGSFVMSLACMVWMCFAGPVWEPGFLLIGSSLICSIGLVCTFSELALCKELEKDLVVYEIMES
jgi:hypothetical protein